MPSYASGALRVNAPDGLECKGLRVCQAFFSGTKTGPRDSGQRSRRTGKEFAIAGSAINLLE